VIQPTGGAIECPEKCRCEEQGSIVNCSNLGFPSIPLNLPTHAGILLLSHYSITFLENDSFVSKGLVNLHIHGANFCKIIKRELGAFNGLTKLMILSLRGNEISEIIPGTFEKISRLVYLLLDHNKIERLGSGVFYGMVNLIFISLEGNKLQYLHSDTFVGFPNLQSL
jgi:Leucine-rich repeat (LRR) protein